MKLCNVCGIAKSHDEFTKSKRTKDGLQAKCKLCDAIHHKTRRESNVAYYQAKTNKYRLKWNYSNGIGVYCLWNKIDECYDYVGEGVLNDRHYTHRLGIHKATPDEIKLNIWLDGFDNVYEFRVLCRCENKQQCKDMENEYIAQLNPRYNIKQRKKCEK